MTQYCVMRKMSSLLKLFWGYNGGNALNVVFLERLGGQPLAVVLLKYDKINNKRRQANNSTFKPPYQNRTQILPLPVIRC
jgi:hypothetical protein